MINLLRTDSSNQDFIELVKALDEYIRIINKEQNAFYSQFNKIDTIKNVVVAFEGNKAVSCGAFKYFSPGTVEIKRMYTIPEQRGKGIAKLILAELEKWAAELSNKNCILETGIEFIDAISLYTNQGYSRIPNFEPYTDVENSVCFEKIIW